MAVRLDDELTRGMLAAMISGVCCCAKLTFRGVLAVLFDMDGTLVETRIDFGAMKGAVLRQAGERGLDASALADLDILAIVEEAAARVPESERAGYRNAAWRMLEEFEMRNIADARPMPGAGDSLLRLRGAGLKLGIITRNCRAAALRMAELLPSVFEVCLTREDVSRCKPDPLHISAALELIGVPARAALVAGDHRMDIQAGRAAGTRTAGMLFDKAEGYFDSYQPDAVFRTLKELTDAILGPDR